MDVELESSEVLYLVGALLGVVAIVYFSAEIIVELSPTLKSVILLLGFVFFFGAAQYAESTLLDAVLYVLAAGSYVVFLGYTVLRFSLGENGVFLLLAASSALFIGLGYALHELRLGLDRRQAIGVMILVVVVVVAGTGFDFLGPQATVDTDFRDTVSVGDVGSPDEQVVIGEVTANNPFVLSRTAELPNLQACLPATGGVQPLSYRGEDAGFVSRNMLLGGGEEKTFRITLQAVAFYNRSSGPPRIDERYRNASLPVERTDECRPAGDTDDTRILVVENPSPPRFD